MLFLEERIFDVTPKPPIPPSDMIIIPTDADIEASPLTEEEITSQDPDLPNILPVVAYFHSLLQREDMYKLLGEALDDEQKNLIDRSIELLKINDIQYYNKNKEMFFRKVDSWLRELGVNFPSFYLPFVNSDVSATPSITREHDFIRNIINNTWLLRKWAGSTNGYKILFRLFTRLGAVHLTSKYKTGSSADQSTERIFRLIDLEKLSPMYPSSPTFPDSVHIEGADSLLAIESLLFKWDTSRIWDENPPIAWDISSASADYGKGIALEFSLDRILYVSPPNSIIQKSLMHNELLSAYNLLLPIIKKAGASVKLGSQITLLTDNTGTFNNLSREDYTHPNIEAKFQTYQGKYLSGSNIRYIKTGSKGYNSPTRDATFVPYDMDPSLYEVPLDVEGSEFSYIGYIDSNEFLPFGAFDVIHTMLHNRSVNLMGINTIGLTMNGKDVPLHAMVPTSIQLQNPYVTPGSVVLDLNISLKKQVEYTVTTYSSFTSPITITFLGKEVVIPPVANSLALIAYLKDQTYPGWEQDTAPDTAIRVSASNGLSNSHSIETIITPSFTLSSNIIEDGENAQSIFQRVIISEDGNTNTNEYFGKVSFKELGSDNTIWTEIGDSVSTDPILADYASAYGEDDYGAINTRAFNFNPLVEQDKYPTLFDGITSFISGEYSSETDVVPSLPTATSSYTKTNWEVPDSWSTNGIDAVASFTPEYVRLTYNNTTGSDFERSFTLPTSKAVVFKASANIPNTVFHVDILSSAVRSRIGTFSLSTTSTTFSCLTPSDVDAVYFVADSPAVGLLIDIKEFYLGDLDSFSLFDNGLMSRTITAQNMIREDGIYSNKFRAIGVGSKITLNPTFSSNVNRSFIAHISSVGDGVIFKHGTTPALSLTKTGLVLQFSAVFADSNGVWEWTLPTGTEWWVALSYSYLESGVPILRVNGITLPATEISAPSGLSEVLSIPGQNMVLMEDMEGYIQEVRYYNRLVTSTEVENIIGVTPTKLDPLLNKKGLPLSAYVNHSEGFVIVKPCYNKTGVYKDVPSADATISTYIPVTDQKYELSNFKGLSVISEVGLFDINDEMVAYATFPPVVYDASKFHLSFNFMIQRGGT